MELKDKALNGVFWNLIAKFGNYGLEFIIGIILARILSPDKFGVIASITVIIAFLEVFINSGFSQALIREKIIDKKVFSTIFWFNLFLGIIVYFILYLFAPFLSSFFNTGDITSYIQILGLVLIINSISLIQRTILTKEINFKKQTFISIISTLVSGISAIVLALNGFGIWSLVLKIVLFRLTEGVLLWIVNKWKPIFTFQIVELRRLSVFASKLLISGTIDVLFKNINYIFVSKVFSAKTLGFFTRAEMFKNLPSQNLTSVITTVSYPVLIEIKDERIKLTNAFTKIFGVTYYISAISMLILLGVSKNLILMLLGEKWLGSVVLLQLLCLIGLFNPINSLCGNLLNVVGRSDIYMKLQIISNILLIPSLIAGYFYGIIFLVISNLIATVVIYFLFGKFSSKFIDFTFGNQLKIILKMILLGGVLAIILLFIQELNLEVHLGFLIQIIFSILYIIFISEAFKIKEYLILKGSIIKKIYG